MSTKMASTTTSNSEHDPTYRGEDREGNGVPVRLQQRQLRYDDDDTTTTKPCHSNTTTSTTTAVFDTTTSTTTAVFDTTTSTTTAVFDTTTSTTTAVFDTTNSDGADTASGKGSTATTTDQLQSNDRNSDEWAQTGARVVARCAWFSFLFRFFSYFLS
jgi:hypothetical protein